MCEVSVQVNQETHEIEDLKKQLDYTYDYVIESWERVQELSQSKWCKKCNTTNIDNKKRTCPNYNEKLDTLAALQAESANEFAQLNNIAFQSKPLIIKSHSYTHEQKSSHFKCISITQRSEPDDDVIVPEIYVPDPLEFNPNSINNDTGLKTNLGILKNAPIITNRYHHQHQDLDAILEEVNKSLKALIPPIPSQKHWKIAARNCTKFIKLRHILFNMIRYTDNESLGGNDHTFKSLGDEHLLSEKLKNFTDLAYERRIKFIDETFKENRPNYSLRPIPVTAQEEAATRDEANIDLHNEQDEPKDEIELEN
ncbi:9273_t:CDS:2 [Scutellospora calospora]|uniref:9273_t:CDS:1 n=1 Tax=Scutellospora calospora TaxID=85575 RepID=A0ACA9K292_9GLOM|nr:9273_t:CDS:2 [Scutellospora calospora]